MPATIMVMGDVNRPMGGLKESLKAFATQSSETGDALLNITDGARGVMNSSGERLGKDDPRPQYQHQEFPRMMYHAKYEPRVVSDEKGFKDAELEGYRKTPYVVTRAVVADPGVEKAELNRQLKEKDGQIANLADQIREMQEQLSQLMKSSALSNKKSA